MLTSAFKFYYLSVWVFFSLSGIKFSLIFFYHRNCLITLCCLNMSNIIYESVKYTWMNIICFQNVSVPNTHIRMNYWKFQSFAQVKSEIIWYIWVCPWNWVKKCDIHGKLEHDKFLDSCWCSYFKCFIQRTLIRVHAFKDKDYLHRQVKNLVICQCVWKLPTLHGHRCPCRVGN